jgi:hypothetical protein
VSSKRDALREKALAGREAKAVLVEFEGEQYEIRAPSVRARNKILEKAGAYAAAADKSGKKQVDAAALQVAAVIACTYAPRTEEEIRQGVEPERVFDDSDFEVLVNKPAGDITDALGEVAIKLVNVSAEKVREDAKND